MFNSKFIVLDVLEMVEFHLSPFFSMVLVARDL